MLVMKIMIDMISNDDGHDQGYDQGQCEDDYHGGHDAFLVMVVTVVMISWWS